MTRNGQATELVARLTAALGERLQSVVRYGPSARDAAYPAAIGEHVLIVVVDLDLDTLQRLSAPVRWWLRKDEPWPRVFSHALLRASLDVYPIEFLEIAQHGHVLYGEDPLADANIDHAHLRVQCERELREKLMRLREGYIVCHGQRGGRALHELLAISYPSFVRIARACLYLVGAPSPQHDREVMIALARWLDLPSKPFEDVEHIARGERKHEAEAVFTAYYRALVAAEARIDRLLIHPERRTS